MRHDTPPQSGLVVERRGPVGWLVFDRPASANAMHAALIAALPAAWRELDADPEVRAIVVTGRGRAFQTGLDLAALAGDPASLREATRRTRDADLALTGWHLGVATPVIVAVNGVCAGGGLHFVVDGDIVIASTAATFVDPHVSVGQASAWEAVGLAHRIPFGAAAELALGGRHVRIDAARARQLGLVSEVVDPAELQPRAQQIGEWLADSDETVLRDYKRALWSAEECGRTEVRRRLAARTPRADQERLPR